MISFVACLVGSRGERPLAVLGVEQRTYLVCGDTELTMHLSLNNVNVWRMQWLRGTERVRDTEGGGCRVSLLHFIPFSHRSTRSAEARGSSSQLICGTNQQGVFFAAENAERSRFLPFPEALSPSTHLVYSLKTQSFSYPIGEVHFLDDYSIQK